MKLLTTICLLLIFSIASAAEISKKPLLKTDDNIVFVGDSITGQSFNMRNGYNHIIRRALDAAYPSNKISLTSLGGSGQGVNSWLGSEKNSRTKPVFMDVKGVDLQKVLTKDVDVIVIMLGMNDSLHPYFNDDKESIAKWAQAYTQLITTLRERCQPRVIGLATVTPNSEDRNSPKNIFLAQLGEQIAAIAKKQKCFVLPVADAAWDMQSQGRRLKPDFHLTNDFVHPNHFGHAAIAYGMLKGLGEAKAAAHTMKHDFLGELNILKEKVTPLSYELLDPTIDAKGIYKAKLAWYWNGNGMAKAGVKVPKGWKIKTAKGAKATNGRQGYIDIEGPLDRLETKLLLRAKGGAKGHEHLIKIPAPWLIAHGFRNMQTWKHGSWDYMPEKGKMPAEDDILAGRYIGKTPKGWKTPLKWSRVVPSVDHTYGAVAGNVNMYQVDFSNGFSGAYGMRWIYTEQPRDVRLVIGTRVFAGAFAVMAKLNGADVYKGVITKEPGRRVERKLSLNKGWNLLSFKSNNMNWQWQFSLDLESDTPLDDLRVAISPQKTPSKKK